MHILGTLGFSYYYHNVPHLLQAHSARWCLLLLMQMTAGRTDERTQWGKGWQGRKDGPGSVKKELSGTEKGVAFTSTLGGIWPGLTYMMLCLQVLHPTGFSTMLHRGCVIMQCNVPQPDFLPANAPCRWWGGDRHRPPWPGVLRRRVICSFIWRQVTHFQRASYRWLTHKPLIASFACLRMWGGGGFWPGFPTALLSFRGNVPTCSEERKLLRQQEGVGG